MTEYILMFLLILQIIFMGIETFIYIKYIKSMKLNIMKSQNQSLKNQGKNFYLRK